MISQRMQRLLFVVLLLALGAILSQVWVRQGAVTVSASLAAPILRPFDLMVQLGLMLVSALGIRALLPGEDELEEREETDD